MIEKIKNLLTITTLQANIMYILGKNNFLDVSMWFYWAGLQVRKLQKLIRFRELDPTTVPGEKKKTCTHVAVCVTNVKLTYGPLDVEYINWPMQACTKLVLTYLNRAIYKN